MAFVVFCIENSGEQQRIADFSIIFNVHAEQFEVRFIGVAVHTVTNTSDLLRRHNDQFTPESAGAKLGVFVVDIRIFYREFNTVFFGDQMIIGGIDKGYCFRL